MYITFREARWFQEDCSFEKSFVCKYSENIPPTPPPRGPCPDGWFNYVSKNFILLFFSSEATL